MKKIILLFIIFSVSVSATPWLTNGIDPTDISFFGDVTGDGFSDVVYNYSYSSEYKCYKNINNNENPIFEEYRDVFGFIKSNDIFNTTPKRIRDGGFWYGTYQYNFISNCTFSLIKNSNKFITSRGNDITDNGLDDWINMRAGVVIINITTNMGWRYMYYNGQTYTNWGSLGYYKPVKDETGTLIYTDTTEDQFITQLHPGEFDAYIKPKSDVWNLSRVYRIDTPTNWTFLRIDKQIQCYGDWDNDGIEDYMFKDGEVVLGSLPEPFIPQFLLISIAIFCRWPFRFSEKRISMVT